MKRNFWILSIGQAISLLGSSFGNLAHAWLVYELTGSKLAMGTIILAGTIPETLLRLMGGPLVDRLNRVLLLRALDVTQACLYAAPPLLAATGHLRLWHIYAFAVTAGLVRSLYAPAYLALVPSVVAKEHLVRANSVAQSLTSIGSLLGPALAGGLVASFGPIPAMLIDAVSYGCSALALFLIPGALGRSERKVGGESYFAQLGGGFRFFLQTPILLVVVASVMTINFMWAGWNSMMVPFVVERLGAGAGVTGLPPAAISAGILAGGVLTGWAGDRWRNRFALLVPVICAGFAVMGLSVVGRGGVLPMVLLVAVLGLAMGIFTPLASALYQRLVPDDLRGRVMAVRVTLAFSAQPLGAFIGALIADRAGLPSMLLVFGLVGVVVNLAALFSPAFSVMERPADGMACD